MFSKFLEWIRKVWSNMFNASSVKTALRVDVAINSDMANALQTWSLMYTNKANWLNDYVKSLNLPAAIAAEVARAVTIEMDMTLSGSARADYLAKQMRTVLAKLRTHTEYAAAKGGMMFKPYIDGKNISVDFVQADQFYPITFDANGDMTACAFADQKINGNVYYTRLEYHTLANDGYKIMNRAFRSTSKEALGNEIPLTAIGEWSDLEPEVTILNIDRPLFAYFKMPFANNIDPTSPLGVSVYSRAVELIEQADHQWSDLLWEFESGKRALYADVDMFDRDADNKPILPHRRLYRTMKGIGKIDGEALCEEGTPKWREANIVAGLDAILKRIEFTCGLAQGTISDPSTVALTATEIKMSKQRTYATITDTQKSLQIALDSLLYAMSNWTDIGNLGPKGTYSVSYWWDDSIVADHDTAFTQDAEAVSMGIMSKIEFRMRNYGEDEQTAREKIALVTQEQQSVGFFDNE